MFKSTEIKKAWQIRKDAAVRYNCHVMVIRWAECLRLARMAPVQSMKSQIINHDEVVSYKEWTKGNQNRTYLTLKGAQRSYRGDMNCQVYFDNNTQKVVVIRGKGMTSRTMDASIEAIQNI